MNEMMNVGIDVWSQTTWVLVPIIFVGIALLANDVINWSYSDKR